MSSTSHVASAGQDASRSGSRLPDAPKTGYIRTLDGWRTIAVFAVILFHSPPIVIAGRNWRSWQEFGNRGVELFFAISGLLICTRLLEEQRLTGRIHMGGFYVRRLFRIQPAAMVFLLGIVLLTWLGVLHTTWPATLSALFSYRNFFTALGLATGADDRYTGHFWSLAVEEHFYLLLPAVLVVARKRLIAVLGVLSAAFFVWPPLAHRVLGLTQSALAEFRTDMALRDLLVPALMAALLVRPGVRDWVTRVTSRGYLLGGVVVAVAAAELLGGHLTGMVTCLGFPVMVVSTMMHPRQWMGRVLESGLMRSLGRLSYSLYLWQQIFFMTGSKDSPLGWVQRFPLNLAGALTCAVASYYLVEKPMIRLGHRFAPPATPGRGDLKDEARAV